VNDWSSDADLEIRGRFLGRPQIALRDGALVVGTIFGRRSIDDASQIARIVCADAAYARFGPDRDYLWLFVDATGRGLLRLHPLKWHRGDLERLRAALDVPLEVRGVGGTVAGLRREFPGVLPWWEAHLAATTFLVMLALVVVWALLSWP
jgi:hypothetical protein